MTTKVADQYNHICLYLEKKVSLMTQYLSITRNLKDSFAQEKEINLEGLLAKRQDCIDKMEKMDLSLKKISRQGAEELSRISRELNGKLGGYLQRIKGLVEQIAPMDAEVMAMVREESRDIREELTKMKQAKQAAKEYGSRESHIPRYVDANG
jgi:small-conductance mechanosensitive channel